MPQLYSHYSDYTGPWPWADFTPAEISCRHCGEMYLDEAAIRPATKYFTAGAGG